MNTLTILIVAGVASIATLASVLLPVLHLAGAAQGTRFTAVSFREGIVNIQTVKNQAGPLKSFSATADGALDRVPDGATIGGSLALDDISPTCKFYIVNESTGPAVATIDGIHESVLVIQTSRPVPTADAIGAEQGSNSTNADAPYLIETNPGAPL